MGTSRSLPSEPDTDEDDLAEGDAAEGPPRRRHEVFGLLALAATVLFTLALASYDVRGGENWIGPVGAALGGVIAQAFGLAAWVLPVELALLTLRLFTGRGAPLGLARAGSTLVYLLVGCAMLHLALRGVPAFGGELAGGLLGEVAGEVLRSMLGLAGAFVVGVTVLLVTLVLRTSLSVVALSRLAAGGTKKASERTWEGAQSAWKAWQEARALERAEREAAAAASAPRIVTSEEPEESSQRVTTLRDADEQDADVDDGHDDVYEMAEPAAPRAAGPTTLVDLVAPDGDEPAKAKKKKKDDGPTIIAPISRPTKESKAALPPVAPATPDGRPFVLPPSTLLAPVPKEQIIVDEKTLRDNAARLVDKLHAYGVSGRVDEIHPGPVVTMYELEPESGTKVAKIASLADDLAMALAAQKVRIVAPIPGKARVGFELPNKVRQSVSLREILEDHRWRESQAALPMALGKDIAGQPVYVDLAKMPHMLVAGATGAGKSVGLNVMLASLLMRKTPEEVRLLMIDPKVVELAAFDGIPHMLLPVVTDMKKASLSLRWAVDEMERRYQLFADAGAKNITTYNERVEKVQRGEMSVDRLHPRRAGKVLAQGPDGEEVLLGPDDGEAPDAQKPPTKLPYVVVVVDEFADLMMVAAKDVEGAVARLAQKARAAGIHVILATQRPSVDVITGMIKANFPARIAFKVSQREDSKTILGRQGAEHLLGMGDMLMIPPGAADLKRVHCAYISEEEVEKLCDHLRAQAKPVYDENILKPRDDEDGEGGLGAVGEPSDDPLYDKAVAAVAQAGYCSISHLQRVLKVGYNKAATLVERMEKEGVVGPSSGKAGGRRDVLIQAM